MSSERPGKLIVIEGIDGSGKTTQEQFVVNFLEDRGFHCLVTKQPSDWYRSQPSVRRFLDDGVRLCSQETLGLLAAADRMQHIETVIAPALAEGVHVVCNRYVYSTYAYFTARGADMEFIRAINSRVPAPDVGILLMIDPEESIARIRRRDGDRNKFEERDAGYLGVVQDALRLHCPPWFLVAEAQRSEDELRTAIAAHIESML